MPESHSLPSGQTVPELPPNPPAILADVLEYTFRELGLDDLTLIDLRGLDTPPALGANVIMIIGTARSVKHLNVSADRLCRWLRSTWKLSPYADGLLGRNELKIKLRRKARRARIASTAGAMLDEKDDGITTGWICVNAGLIKDETVPDAPKERNFEGFGDVSEGSRIVVQIFTEEKRAEVDLDGLWNSALQRAERRKLKLLSETQPEATVQETALSESAHSLPSSSPATSGRPQQLPVNVSVGQKRGLHSTRALAKFAQRSSREPAPAFYVSILPTETSSASAPSPEDAHAGLNYRKYFASLFDGLHSIPASAARRELGHGPDDRDSTLFLRLLNNPDPEVPDEIRASAKLRQFILGISVLHPAFTKESLWEVLQDYLAAGYPLTARLGRHLLKTFLTGRSPSDPSHDSPPLLPQSDVEFALRLLAHLSVRGVNVLNMEILSLLYGSVSRSSTEYMSVTQERSTADVSAVTTTDKSVILRRLAWIMQVVNPPFTSEQARAILPHLFQNGDFDAFWTFWRKIPIQGIARTAADYEMLFRLHAQLGDRRRARDCLAMWVPIMQREEPPVKLSDEVARQVISCTLVADPEVVQKAKVSLEEKQALHAEHPTEDVTESSAETPTPQYYAQPTIEDGKSVWRAPPQKEDNLVLLLMACREALLAEQDGGSVQYGS